MSRSVFANTIGAFVLDGIPSHVRSNEGYMDTLIEEGKEKAKGYAADAAQYALDSALERSGITSGQSSDVIVVPQQSSDVIVAPQQSTHQGVNYQAVSSGLASDPRLFKYYPLLATAGGVSDAQRRVQQAQDFEIELLTRQDQSQDSETPEKKKKPFFKTGAGIATILVSAAAIAGGIVYFATQE